MEQGKRVKIEKDERNDHKIKMGRKKKRDGEEERDRGSVAPVLCS